MMTDKEIQANLADVKELNSVCEGMNDNQEIPFTVQDIRLLCELLESMENKMKKD